MTTQPDRAQVLIEALPYIQAFHNKTIVVKYGGAAMVDDALKHQFAQDIVLLKYVGVNPVVVHGGGPMISQMLERLGMTPTFVDGIRVTDRETMEVVEMVLGGRVNKDIVNRINRHGGNAVGLTGKDGNLLMAKPISKAASGPDMGFVGQVETVSPDLLYRLDDARYIPVIAPIGVDADGQTYNINADLAASALARALHAEKLVLLTDVAGILDGDGELLSSLRQPEVKRLIDSGVISGGMLPKVQACVEALEGGVAKAHILDGRTPHAMLLELFTDGGIGTEMLPC